MKKNKKFFLNYPELLEELEFPIQLKTNNKIIDINAYRSLKLKSNYDRLKKLTSKILKAGSSHIINQKRILRTSLKILNTRSLTKLIDLIVKDFKTLLSCDIVNCYGSIEKKYNKHLNQIDKKIVATFFQNKSQIYINQNLKGIPLFFPNSSKTVKSYILLKVNIKNNFLIIAMGSKNLKKYSPDLKVDLVDYIIKIMQFKLNNYY